MFFNKNKEKCSNCGSSLAEINNFCPYCGNKFVDAKKEASDFGLLGRDDFSDPETNQLQPSGFGITDKIFQSLMNSMMKTLDKQIKGDIKNTDNFTDAEIKGLPNGIKIKISGPIFARPQQVQKQQRAPPRQIAEQQIKRMSSLPKEKAKTQVKRFGNKVVYELTTPGVVSVDDIFVSKLETGWEIKAIGDKKVYVNNVPINLPIKRYSITKDKLFFEFVSGFDDN